MMKWYENIVEDFDIVPEKTALVLIDMNYVDCHRDYGIASMIKELGEAEFNYYFDRVDNLVIPNLQRLLEVFRNHKMKVIYTIVGYQNPDKSDLPRFIKNPRLGWLDKSCPGNKEFEVREEVKPQKGDICIIKPCSGSFAGTNLDQKLKNMGIDTLVVTGVVTDGCVYNTAVPASDRGYKVIVVDDATATLTQESHDAYLRGFAGGVFFKVKTTDEVIEDIKKAV